MECAIVKYYDELVWISAFIHGFEPFDMFDLAGFLRLPQVVVLDDDTFIFELWVIATDSSSLCSKQ